MTALLRKLKSFVRRYRPNATDFRALKALQTLALNLGWDRDVRDGSWHHTDLSPKRKKAISSAVDTLHLYFGPAMPPAYRGGWDAFLDEHEPPTVIDAGEAEQARSLILRGEVDDCLHHLEHALPAEYAVIAERLALHFRSRP